MKKSTKPPQVLGIARVVIALMTMEHVTSKLLRFPAPTATPDPFTLLWFAAIIEIVGSALLGLPTRLAAFIIMSTRLSYEQCV